VNPANSCANTLVPICDLSPLEPICYQKPWCCADRPTTRNTKILLETPGSPQGVDLLLLPASGT